MAGRGPCCNAGLTDTGVHRPEQCESALRAAGTDGPSGAGATTTSVMTVAPTPSSQHLSKVHPAGSLGQSSCNLAADKEY